MVESAKRDSGKLQRQCALTRLQCGTDELLRFVVGPDGIVVPDLKANLPGRGVWICCARDTIEQAAASGIFSRSFRRSVHVPPDMPDQVDHLLERAALQRLSLANKAGLVVCGFDKVSRALQSGGVTLIHASDAAADGCRKLDRLSGNPAGALGPDKGPIRHFNAEQLSLALGRPNVVHAAVRQGGPRGSFLDSVARLEKFRAGSTADAAA